MRSGSYLVLALAALAALGCRNEKPERARAAASSSARSPAAAPPEGRARELFRAEARRDSKAVSSSDLESREPAVRRAAARALARIADAHAAELLTRALADEDREVVTWSAYGLGQACRGREPATVRALVARAASLSDAADPLAPDDASGPLVSPLAAISDALGRCGTLEAERTLRAWLEGPRARAESAALALGTLAAVHGRLEDSSLALLLDAASRPEAPLAHALFPFTRLPALGEPVRERLLEIAKAAVRAGGTARAFAVRALGQAGPAAAAELGAVLTDTGSPLDSRADAARELARLGEPGQVALRSALPALAAEPLQDDAKLLHAEYGLLLRALQSLTPPVRDARELLERIATLPLAPGDSAALRRRKVALRCRAAGLLAGRATLSERLRDCDPDAGGRAGALAVVEVLDRGELKGARAQRFRSLAASSDAVVRQAALALLGGHSELEKAYDVLAEALASKVPGVVIAAARVLARYPERAQASAPAAPEAAGDPSRPLTHKPHPKLIAAFTAAFEAAQASNDVEIETALMEAGAALQLLGIKPVLERRCTSANSTLRARAEAALRVLGDRERRCSEVTPSTASYDADASLLGPTRVRLTTDAGELSLTLDPELAPLAVTRVLDLLRAGFYDGMIVHRAVPGFVVQFGDPSGDGYGGSGKPALPCETSPARFAPGSVGMALSGRDTGDSQLFVTLGDYPHLNGEYALVGKAEGAWDRLVEGDVIQKATIVR